MKKNYSILTIFFLVLSFIPLSAFAEWGVPDTTFTANIGTGFNNVIQKTAIQSDGKIVVGGNFTSFNGTSSNYIARLNAEGTLDTTFTTNIGTGFNAAPSALAIQSDGKIVVGGAFTSFNGTGINYITRLNSNGTLDTTFNTNIASTGIVSAVKAIAIQSDGKIVIGGSALNSLVSLGFNGYSNIARLNSDGTQDTGYIADVEGGEIVDILIQSDGKIILSGNAFQTSDFWFIADLIRLNSDGALDTSFYPSLNSTVDGGRIFKMTLQSDGKIVVGGSFSGFSDGTDLISTNRIARLNSDGTLDTTFTTNTGTGFDGAIRSIAILSDGKIIVGGSFTSFNGTNANRIARINSNGTIDSTFTIGTGFDNFTSELAIQPDGKIVVGGSLTSFNGTSSNYIARLQQDSAPTLTTGSASSITSTTATLGGNITDVGVSNATSRGINYGLTTGYGSTASDTGSYGNGAYTKTITGLVCNTLYHYRAFATNTAGTVNGADATFTTGSCVVAPTITTGSSSSITSTTATLGGNITATGGAKPTIRGINYGLTTDYGSTVSETGSYSTGVYTEDITGLVCNTLYHYQAFATNSAGTTNGTDSTFTTGYCAIPRGSHPLFMSNTISPTKKLVTPAAITETVKCEPSIILTQNLRPGARDGVYNSFTKEKAKEVKILQAHMNRLGYTAGKEDGILGPITKGAIMRMQKFLGTTQDGMVGPLTREKINNSCEKER